ncbi:MAG: ABC transporter substrate-binding protein [Campylobacteraceae bacterium]
MSFKKGFAYLVATVALMAPNVLFAEKIVDIVGREVEVPKKVERILLGEGRYFHALALLEGDEPFKRIVGWQGDFKKLDPQNYNEYKKKFPQIDDIPLIGGSTTDTVSNEKVLMLNPDIAIFGISGHGPMQEGSLVGLLERMGVPVVFVDFRSYPLKNTIPSMKILGKMLGREDEANEYIEFYTAKLDEIKKRVATIPEDKKVKAFIELRAGSSDDCCLTAGNGSMGEFIEVAGGKNIATGLLPGVFGNVNLEKLLMENPDVYIITGTQTKDSTANGAKLGAEVDYESALGSANTLLKRKIIEHLGAVKNHRTSAIWHGYYNIPQNIIAIEAFAKWLYPELFSDVDLESTRAYIHKNFLAIEPTGTFWVDDYNIAK